MINLKLFLFTCIVLIIEQIYVFLDIYVPIDAKEEIEIC